MQNNFDVFVPVIKTDAKYSVTGADCQVLSVALKPGETLLSEPGAMMMMSPQIKTDMECGACSRPCTGETCCVVVYRNEGSQNGYDIMIFCSVYN